MTRLIRLRKTETSLRMDTVGVYSTWEAEAGGCEFEACADYLSLLWNSCLIWSMYLTRVLMQFWPCLFPGKTGCWTQYALGCHAHNSPVLLPSACGKSLQCWYPLPFNCDCSLPGLQFLISLYVTCFQKQLPVLFLLNLISGLSRCLSG